MPDERFCQEEWAYFGSQFIEILSIIEGKHGDALKHKAGRSHCVAPLEAVSVGSLATSRVPLPPLYLLGDSKSGQSDKEYPLLSSLHFVFLLPPTHC